MGISAQLGRFALGAAAMLIGLAFAGVAQAVPIYTYTFVQTGFVGPGGAATPGTVTGSFSGALDSGGHITWDTLTAFHFESSGFDGTAYSSNWSHDGLPYIFSYIPGDTGSFTLLDYSSFDGHSNFCIGSTVAFYCNGGSAPGAGAYNVAGPSSTFTSILLYTTNSLPVLSGSVVDVGDPVFLTATTPIPASLLLFATAFASLSSLAIIRRRRQNPIALAA